MIHTRTLMLTVIGATLLAVGVAPYPASAQAPSAAPMPERERRARAEAEAAERQARALEAAEAEQRAALEAVEAARRELAKRAEEVRRLAEENRQRALDAQAKAEDRSREQEALRERALEERAVEHEELRKIRRELERAHANLRKASREVAQVHRDLHREDRVFVTAPRVGGNRAVIGVILGENVENGVRVIGVSPDGPAERAGLRQGDVIVSLMDEPLTVEGGDARDVLTDAMAAIEPGDELKIVVQRDGERIERNITAEERTPFSWHSVTRLGIRGAPDASIFIESLDVPEFDRAQLERELERELESVRERIEQERIVIEAEGERDGEAFRYEFETFSDIGDAALAGTDIWFGMPLARGLKFAELDAGLADYFGTDRGVLVLQAREGNVLQLRSGDVIQAVGDTSVRRPADVMRALRGVDAGATVELQIMRRQASETLTVEIPETRLGLRLPADAPVVRGWRLRRDAPDGEELPPSPEVAPGID